MDIKKITLLINTNITTQNMSFFIITGHYVTTVL